MDNNIYFSVVINEVIFDLKLRAIISDKLYEATTFSDYWDAVNYCDKITNKKLIPENGKVVIKIPKIYKEDNFLYSRDITPGMYSLENQLCRSVI